MSKRQTLKDLALAKIGAQYKLTKLDIGEDANLKKNGFTFDVESYDVEGLGHLCCMGMNAMAGMMKMETIVLATTEKDVPLFNLDWVKAMGKETQMVEFYDTQLAPLSMQAQDAYQAIKDKDRDLTDRETDPHWYDDILMPFSYDKTGKKLEDRFAITTAEYIDEFLKQAAAAPACNKSEKQAKVRTFAETLFAQGGPAVDNVTKLFGKEVAGRLILQHMYGC